MIELSCKNCFSDLVRTPIRDEWECIGCGTHFLIREEKITIHRTSYMADEIKEGVWWFYRKPVPPNTYVLGYGSKSIELDSDLVALMRDPALCSIHSTWQAMETRFMRHLRLKAEKLKPDLTYEEWEDLISKQVGHRLPIGIRQ